MLTENKITTISLIISLIPTGIPVSVSLGSFRAHDTSTLPGSHVPPRYWEAKGAAALTGVAPNSSVSLFTASTEDAEYK